MVAASYNHNHARKMLKNIDEIFEFDEMLFFNDEVITEFIEVTCNACGMTHHSPQVIMNPSGYGSEGAMLLQQHHTCKKCGSDSRITESIYELLLRIRECEIHEDLETVV